MGSGCTDQFRDDDPCLLTAQKQALRELQASSLLRQTLQDWQRTTCWQTVTARRALKNDSMQLKSDTRRKGELAEQTEEGE